MLSVKFLPTNYSDLMDRSSGNAGSPYYALPCNVEQ